MKKSLLIKLNDEYQKIKFRRDRYKNKTKKISYTMTFQIYLHLFAFKINLNIISSNNFMRVFYVRLTLPKLVRNCLYRL